MGGAVFGFHVKLAATKASDASAAAIKSSDKFFAEISAEERQLASELAKVMAQPPIRIPAHPEQPAASSPSFGYEPNDPFATSDRGFSWTSGDEQADPEGAAAPASSEDNIEAEDMRPAVTPQSSAAWLKRARREKNWAQARDISAYVLTLLIGGFIVAATAYFVTGERLDAIGLLSTTTSRFF